MDVESFLNDLSNGTLTSSGVSDKISIYDAEGSKLYTDCWNYGDSVRENYAPLGAANLLQVVNERPELNGKLMVIYDHLASVLTSIMINTADIRAGGNTWKRETQTLLIYI